MLLFSKRGVEDEGCVSPLREGVRDLRAAAALGRGVLRCRVHLLLRGGARPAVLHDGRGHLRAADRHPVGQAVRGGHGRLPHSKISVPNLS